MFFDFAVTDCNSSVRKLGVTVADLEGVSGVAAPSHFLKSFLYVTNTVCALFIGPWIHHRASDI